MRKLNIDLQAIIRKYRLLPEYTEVSLFLLLISFTLIVVFQQDLRDAVIALFYSDLLKLNEVIFRLLVVVPGIFFIIYYTLNFKKGPGPYARSGILVTVIFLELFIAFSLGMYWFRSESTYGIILALLNLLYVLFLLFAEEAGLFNEGNISGKNSKKHEIVIGTFSIAILYCFLKFVFNMDWPLMLGTLATYAVIFNEMISTKLYKSVLR
jgi:hypothetical protein